MTKHQIEKILGYDIDLNPIEEKFVGGTVKPGWEAAANWEHGTIVVKGKTKEDSLTLLLNTIYQARSAWVMKKQRYRCAECGELNRLEIDHIIPRSKGRDDRLTNLRAICASFTGCRAHERKHSG
jgi:hypothetical protein